MWETGRQRGKGISHFLPDLLSHEHFGTKMPNDHALVSTICQHVLLKILSPRLTHTRFFHLSCFLSISSSLLQFFKPSVLFPVCLSVTNNIFWPSFPLLNNILPWCECIYFRLIWLPVNSTLHLLFLFLKIIYTHDSLCSRYVPNLWAATIFMFHGLGGTQGIFCNSLDRR